MDIPKGSLPKYFGYRTLPPLCADGYLISGFILQATLPLSYVETVNKPGSANRSGFGP